MSKRRPGFWSRARVALVVALAILVLPQNPRFAPLADVQLFVVSVTRRLRLDVLLSHARGRLGGVLLFLSVTTGLVLGLTYLVDAAVRVWQSTRPCVYTVTFLCYFVLAGIVGAMIGLFAAATGLAGAAGFLVVGWSAAFLRCRLCQAGETR